MASMAKLESLDDRQVQGWLRKVDFTMLAIGLLGATAALKSKVFRNLSKNAGAVLERTIRNYETLDAKQLLIQTNADRLEALM